MNYSQSCNIHYPVRWRIRHYINLNNIWKVISSQRVSVKRVSPPSLPFSDIIRTRSLLSFVLYVISSHTLMLISQWKGYWAIEFNVCTSRLRTYHISSYPWRWKKLHLPLKTFQKMWFLPLKNFVKTEASAPKELHFFALPLKKSQVFIIYP